MDDVGSGTTGASGLADGETPGERVGPRVTGPGAGIGEPVALH